MKKRASKVERDEDLAVVVRIFDLNEPATQELESTHASQDVSHQDRCGVRMARRRQIVA